MDHAPSVVGSSPKMDIKYVPIQLLSRLAFFKFNKLFSMT